MIGLTDSFKSFVSLCLQQTFESLNNGLNNIPGLQQWAKKWSYLCFIAYKHCNSFNAENYLQNYEQLSGHFEIGDIIKKAKKNPETIRLLNRFSCELGLAYMQQEQQNQLFKGFKTFIQQFIDFTLFYINQKEDTTVPVNDLYKKLLAEFPIPVIILDSQLKVFDYNELSKKLFTDIALNNKFFRSKVLGNEINKILHYQLTNLFVQDKNQLKFDTYLETNIGKRFYRVMIKKLEMPKVAFEGIMITLDDLSHRKKIEKHLEAARVRAEEADTLKTAFLANMSHEIRTPMNAIVGFSELLASTSPTKKEMDEYLGLIRKSGNDLLHIIEDIIDVAKIESKQLKIKKKVCVPNNLLTDLFNVHKKQLYNMGEDKIVLKLSVPENLTKIAIISDPERLKQVLANLINNAIKFTDEGYIEFGFQKTKDNNLSFFVKDTGIGIPPSQQEKIFDRFVQVEDHQQRNLSGTGLGLTISSNIIKLLGGKMHLKSIVGKGSHFYFTIPFNELDPTQLKQLEIKEKIDKSIPDLSGFNILVAEDDESNYFYISEILKKTRAKVIRAANGLEAINITEQSDDLDLILMDIKMPEINGIEAVKYIQRIKPEIPIIAQTANAMDNDRSMCLKVGCVDYIAKPINKEVLLMKIGEHIKIKQPHIKV